MATKAPAYRDWETENMVEKLTRESKQRDLDEHIHMLEVSAVDTTATVADLTSASIRIKNMIDANQQQIQMARDMHARGVAGVDVSEGRDEAWKEKTIRSLGNREAFDQEFGNVFIETGESAVDEALFEQLRADCCEPTLIYDEGKYLLWDEPKSDRLNDGVQALD